MQINFIKDNQEKIFLSLGFLLIFITGFFSGYFYFQERDSGSNIIIEDIEENCKDLFNEEVASDFDLGDSLDVNSLAQVKGEQSNPVNAIAQNKTGVFVASKNSKIYHSLDCQYVKRIKEENKIFFKSAEEAEEKGYSPHSCVE